MKSGKKRRDYANREVHFHSSGRCNERASGEIGITDEKISNGRDKARNPNCVSQD